MTYSQKNPIAFNEKPASSVKMNEEFVQIYGALNEIDGLKAPLESPALTGSPTAPTQAADDDSTKLATTAFVKDVVADYAPLESPDLTGSPTAPTQSASDDSTKIATTAFVKDQEYFNKTNILGTVSQSGGIPTGAVIERGSNANGEYVKFADGTLVYWQISSSRLTTTGAQGSVFSISAAFTHPINFVSPPAIQVAVLDGLYGRTWGGQVENATTTTVDIYIVGTTSSSSAKAVVLAIGRWF